MVPMLTKAERNARLRPLARLALGIARRNDIGAFIDVAAGRFRTFCVQHNEIAVDYYRAIEPYGASLLTVRYLGKRVLLVEWTSDQVLRTSFEPGEWEPILRRYDGIPALAGLPRST